MLERKANGRNTQLKIPKQGNTKGRQNVMMIVIIIIIIIIIIVAIMIIKLQW